VNDALGIDVLQNRDLDLLAPFCEIERAGVRAVLAQQRSHALAIVRNGKVRQLRTLRGDRHELEDDIDLVGLHVGDARIGCLAHELHLGRIVEQAFGEQARHLDVESLQVALLVLEVPRRVGAAGASHRCQVLRLFACAGSGAGRNHCNRRRHRHSGPVQADDLKTRARLLNITPRTNYW
jgi:hypothetical protein